jgi:hypothetical protein
MELELDRSDSEGDIVFVEEKKEGEMKAEQ